MRVLVCGGRNYDDRATVARTLNDLLFKVKPDEIVIMAGGASGADSLAMNYAMARRVSWKCLSADWKRQGRAAGPIRNQRMLDEGRPDIVVAFPGGRGTADMVKRAREAGVPVMHAGRRWRG